VIRISKSVISFGAVALAAGVFTLAVPRAAHSFAAALVQVTNNVDNPVQNQDVDALGRHPFLSSCGGPDSCTFSVVPANKEWVIQTISVSMSIPPSSPPAVVQLQTMTGGSPAIQCNSWCRPVQLRVLDMPFNRSPPTPTPAPLRYARSCRRLS
jgi:hypothetical protein